MALSITGYQTWTFLVWFLGCCGLDTFYHTVNVDLLIFLYLYSSHPTPSSLSVLANLLGCFITKVVLFCDGFFVLIKIVCKAPPRTPTLYYFQWYLWGFSSTRKWDSPHYFRANSFFSGCPQGSVVTDYAV